MKKRQINKNLYLFEKIKHQPVRTTALIFLVTILSFLILSGALFSISLKNGITGLTERLGADILVVPDGYEQRSENIILGGEPSTFYMKSEILERLKSVNGIEKYSPQLFVASLNAGCCSAAVQIIGYDQKTDFTIGPWIEREFNKTLSEDQIVIGSNVSGKTGGKLKFLDRWYVIAAKMNETGTGFDSSVFMNMDAAKRAAGDYVRKLGGAAVPQNVVSSVAIAVKKGYSVQTVRENIYDTANLKGNKISVIISDTIVNSVSQNMKAIVGFAAAVISVIWIFSVLILMMVFTMIQNERRKEFGIMRLTGASRSDIAGMIFREAGFLSLSGGILGTIFGLVFSGVMNQYLKNMLHMPYLTPSASQMILIVAVCLMLSALTGPLASLFFVRKICRDDTYYVIREGSI